MKFVWRNLWIAPYPVDRGERSSNQFRGDVGQHVDWPVLLLKISSYPISNMSSAKFNFIGGCWNACINSAYHIWNYIHTCLTNTNLGTINIYLTYRPVNVHFYCLVLCVFFCKISFECDVCSVIYVVFKFVYFFSLCCFLC